jgi:predicted  nucleic acid-binding Zn-ribbon protein
MNEDRAIKRYLQIASIEQTMELIESNILDVQKEIDDAGDRLKELQSQKRQLMKDMRDAAKDVGQLPLFDDVAGVLERAPRVGIELHA